MPEVHVKDEFDATIEAVWDVIGDFAGIRKWAQIESLEVEGEGVGAVRTIGMPGGLTLKERLESFDPEAHRFSYSMTETGPLPISNYLATVTLSEAGPDRCAIDWRGSFETPGEAAPVEKMIEGVYTGGIAAIKKLLG